ncbi:MAG: YqaA family protein [Alphaproteobacteria bacterium]
MTDPHSSPGAPSWRHRLARFETWLEGAVHRRGAFWWLVLITALENTVVPLTVEPIVVPLMALYRDRVVPFALAMALGSVLGGLAMYALGLGLSAGLAPWWEGTASAEAAAGFVERLEGEGFWAIFVFAISPLPFQVATLGAGLAGYPLAAFLTAITLGRGLLYAGFAVAVWTLGSTLHGVMERHKLTVLIGGSALAVAVVLALTLLS